MWEGRSHGQPVGDDLDASVVHAGQVVGVEICEPSIGGDSSSPFPCVELTGFAK